MTKKYYKLLTLIVAFLILGLITITSYAYFTANVSGNNSSNNVITSGYMEITYEDENMDEVDVVGMLPGSVKTKTFQVRNTGTVETNYDIYVNNVINNFEVKSDLHCKLQESNLGVIYDDDCPHLSGKLVSGINIDYNVVHNFTFTISFLERNANQDVNQGRTFSTEINIQETESYMVSQLYNRYYNGETDLEFDGVTTLGELGTPDNNLRYIDANPNNYVYFNCNTNAPEYMNDETCEKWRIIGVMSNLEDDDGKIVSNVKIIRDEALGRYSWDSSASEIGHGKGLTQWGETTYEDGTPYEGADLMRELNTDYLGNITVATDGKWYISQNDSKTIQFDDDLIVGSMPNPLSIFSISMINKVKWYSASEGRSYYDATVAELYDRERGDWISRFYYYDNLNRNNEWVGRIALPYPSDFVYSLLKEDPEHKFDNFDSNEHYSVRHFEYEEFYEYNGETHSYTSSKHGDSWLYNKDDALTMTTTTNESYCNYCVMYSDKYNFSHHYPSESSSYVYPSLYLKNTVRIDSGDGSESNPYKLIMIDKHPM